MFMFKDIPGNIEFQIAINGKIVTKDSQECTPKIINGKVFISLHGKEDWVDVTWLAHYAHYETKLPEGLEHRVNDVLFMDTDTTSTRATSTKIMVFKRPFLIDTKFRLIPCFTRYAISRDGQVLDIERQKLIAVSLATKDYPTVSIYNPDKNGYRDVLVHRLVALAWVRNDDYLSKPLVNHINGDKKHYHYRNLEWASYTGNMIHAVNNGLRTDNYICKVYDCIDKSELKFYSVKQACKYMGIKDDIKIQKLAHKTKHKLINDRFQIKLIDDSTPWFYEDKDLGQVSGRYTIYVDGQEYPDLRTFKRIFRVWNVSNINDVMNKARSMYPDKAFSYVDNYSVHSVQSYNVETKEVTRADGIRPLCRMLDLSYARVREALLAGETRVYKGYAFRYENDKPWDTNFTEYRCSSKCILATHKQTNEQLTFKSQREAAKHFNVDRSVIKRFIKNGRYFRSFKLSEI